MLEKEVQEKVQDDLSEKAQERLKDILRSTDYIEMTVTYSEGNLYLSFNHWVRNITHLVGHMMRYSQDLAGNVVIPVSSSPVEVLKEVLVKLEREDMRWVMEYHYFGKGIKELGCLPFSPVGRIS